MKFNKKPIYGKCFYLRNVTFDKKINRWYTFISDERRVARSKNIEKAKFGPKQFKKGQILKNKKRPIKDQIFKKKIAKTQKKHIKEFYKVLLRFKNNRPLNVLFSLKFRKGQKRPKCPSQFISGKHFQKRLNLAFLKATWQPREEEAMQKGSKQILLSKIFQHCSA